MHVPSALSASVAALAILGTACVATSPGTPQPVRTVTATPTADVEDPPQDERVFDGESVGIGVLQILREEYRISGVESVECPEDRPVVVGTSFDCTVRLDGTSKEVTITVKSEEGEYEVGQPR
jgi:hypothetical protein